MVKKYGLRNSQLLTIAPTGTLSTMLGVSGGIEPIFANFYERKTESLYGEDKYYKVYTPIVENIWMIIRLKMILSYLVSL
jgi:ribonucleoside-diphosphate reductase alpha chain